MIEQMLQIALKSYGVVVLTFIIICISIQSS